MFSVTVDDKEYKVEFQHFNPAHPINFNSFDEKYRSSYGTACLLTMNDRNVGVGGTDLHRLDFHSYNKSIGRKLSLYRALHSAFPGEDNKEIRRKFWQAYYEARGDKW